MTSLYLILTNYKPKTAQQDVKQCVYTKNNEVLRPLGNCILHCTRQLIRAFIDTNHLGHEYCFTR